MKHALLAVLVLVGCEPLEIVVGKARLPEVDDAIMTVVDGPLVELPTTVPAKLSGPVRIAADRDVLYADVLSAAEAVETAGGSPQILVAHRGRVVAVLPPSVPVDATKAIRLRAGPKDGVMKACISPPDTLEATCVARRGDDAKHIDRAFVRQLVNQAVKEYGLDEVNVLVDPTLTWADAVRAIDGARTCCGKPVKVQVLVWPMDSPPPT
jgi:hypothetical protein